jgi:hypothetical protein
MKNTLIAVSIASLIAGNLGWAASKAYHAQPAAEPVQAAYDSRTEAQKVSAYDYAGISLAEATVELAALDERIKRAEGWAKIKSGRVFLKGEEERAASAARYEQEDVDELAALKARRADLAGRIERREVAAR